MKLGNSVKLDVYQRLAGSIRTGINLFSEVKYETYDIIVKNTWDKVSEQTNLILRLR